MKLRLRKRKEPDTRSVLLAIRDRVERFGINGQDVPWNGEPTSDRAYCPRGLIMAVCNEANRSAFDTPRSKAGQEALYAMDLATDDRGALGEPAERFAHSLHNAPRSTQIAFIDRALAQIGENK